MKMTSLSDSKELIEFAETAAKHFAEQPQHWSFTRRPTPEGDFLALRWGLDDNCVLVMKLDESFEPVNFQGAVTTEIRKLNGCPESKVELESPWVGPRSHKHCAYCGVLEGDPHKATCQWLRSLDIKNHGAVPDAQMEEAANYGSIDFMECDTCRPKPGSPTLCVGCRHNRRAIQKLTDYLINNRKVNPND